MTPLERVRRYVEAIESHERESLLAGEYVDGRVSACEDILEFIDDELKAMNKAPLCPVEFEEGEG